MFVLDVSGHASEIVRKLSNVELNIKEAIASLKKSTAFQRTACSVKACSKSTGKKSVIRSRHRCDTDSAGLLLDSCIRAGILS